MLRLRRAAVADAAKLSLLGGASFLESFADDHPGDDLVQHVNERHSASAYRQWLGDPDYALWIIEEALGAPVGYAMTGPSTLPGTGPDDFELKRIYVLYRWHGRSLGKKLLEAAIEEAKRRNATRLLLAVYQANHNAQAFYHHLGFTKVGQTEFLVGSTPFTDLVMALTL
jgi:diamine N-acetyltransferase